VTTGISAGERSATVRAMADGASSADTFVRPGHVFPLRYREGGVLRRAGHTEAAVDLSRLAGCAPVGVLCEVRQRRAAAGQAQPRIRPRAAHPGASQRGVPTSHARAARRAPRAARRARAPCACLTHLPA
jgi:3,4-dihydroxy-2-butanone 4-phosphate synthase